MSKKRVKALSANEHKRRAEQSFIANGGCYLNDGQNGFIRAVPANTRKLCNEK